MKSNFSKAVIAAVIAASFSLSLQAATLPKIDTGKMDKMKMDKKMDKMKMKADKKMEKMNKMKADKKMDKMKMKKMSKDTTSKM